MDDYFRTRVTDKNNNLLYYKDSSGHEFRQEFNEDNNIIHYKNSNGCEKWKRYNANGNLISTYKEYTKEFFKIK